MIDPAQQFLADAGLDPAAPVTGRKFATALTAVVEAVKGSVRASQPTARLEEHVVQELVERIEALERRPQLVNQGYWKPGTRYPKHSIVSSSGSAWIAVEDATGRPDTDDPAWQLLAKAGRDGRDRRTTDGEKA